MLPRLLRLQHLELDPRAEAEERPAGADEAEKWSSSSRVGSSSFSDSFPAFTWRDEEEEDGGGGPRQRLLFVFTAELGQERSLGSLQVLLTRSPQVLLVAENITVPHGHDLFVNDPDLL